MDRFRSILRNFTHAPQIRIRLPLVLIAVFMMGFSLSFLVMVDWGTDPYTAMNLAIITKLGISLGNWQAIFNTTLFLIVILCGGEDIGWGTVANMLLIGYLVDFFTWVWAKVFPPDVFTSNLALRIVVMLVAVVIFVISAALYMTGGLGVSPYDAIPFIILRRFPKLPMRALRISYDMTAVLLSILLGGKIYPATLCMAIMLGPVIQFTGKLLQKLIPLPEGKAGVPVE